MERNINLIGISGGKQMGKNTVANIINYLTSTRTYDRSCIEAITATDNHYYKGYSRFKQKSFAAKLKQIVSLLTGVPVEELEEEDIKRSFMPDQWIKEEGNTLELPTYRGFMQKLGTEVVRVLHPRTWEYALFVDYIPKREKVGEAESEEYTNVFPNWIITDVRFPNEAEAIKERGGLHLRVFKPGHLRVWWNDPEDLEQENSSGYYYVQEISGDIWTITEYIDGKGSEASVCVDELDFEGPDSHPSERALDDRWDYFDEIIINDGDLEKLITTVEKVLIKHKII